MNDCPTYPTKRFCAMYQRVDPRGMIWKQSTAACLACTLTCHTEEREERSRAVRRSRPRNFGRKHAMSTGLLREALRGEEGRIFDLLSDELMPEQWAEWLESVLEHAVARGDERLSRKLVDGGAKLGTALCDAVEGGHEEIVKILLESGADPDSPKDPGCFAPLHLAAAHDEVEIIRLLLLNGADENLQNASGTTPLHVAVQGGHVEVAKALVVAGADLHFCFEGVQGSSLHLAANMGNIEVMSMLIEHGADVNDVGAYKGTSALHWAAIASEVGAVDVLAAAGAAVSADNVDGTTPLHIAAAQSDRETVFALLKHGADANHRTSEGESPLHLAAAKCGQEGAVEVVDLLLRNGADETLRDDYDLLAADRLGGSTEDDDRVVEDYERAAELLEKAPTDRAWRRRGYLAMCRAHPGRLRSLKEVDQARAVMTSTTLDRPKRKPKAASPGRIATGDGKGVGISHSDWSIMAARMLRLQEEGIFRTVLGYL